MISTHVLDTSKGNPAEGIEVILEPKLDELYEMIDQGK